MQIVYQTIYPFSPVWEPLDHPGLTVPPDGHHRELSHQHFALSFIYLPVKSWIGLLILCDSILFFTESHNRSTPLPCHLAPSHWGFALLDFSTFVGPPLSLLNLCSFHQVLPAFPTLNALIQEISFPSLWVKIWLV